MTKEWQDFVPGKWCDEINVRDFIQKNYTPYEGSDKFLKKPTNATLKLWELVSKLNEEERAAGGVLAADTKVVSSLTSHKAGYLNKRLEKIVGFQTDKPFKRSLQPFGGIKMSETALKAYGFEIDPTIKFIFNKYRKTHNQGVFDAYTKDMRAARSAAIITGLPDAYGRGRIIGDYRRVALYGVDKLIADKQAYLDNFTGELTSDIIRNREETSEQIRALAELKEMGLIYGVDISQPASNAQEAIQFTYFGYLAAVKDQNGAAMSLGRTSTFLDVYIEKDLKNKVINETQAQEMIDHFIMKLRLVKFMRTPEYNDLFSGDPTWVTESIGGMGLDGRTLVTKTSFRVLHTLINLGAAPEPNLTVLWSTQLPMHFKKFCAKISIETSSIQYENDDLMRVEMGDDYAIACCVSAMRVGKDMQFFGARANLAKSLLYAINGGVDEKSKKQISPRFEPITGDVLEYNEVMAKFTQMNEWLAGLYVNTLNVIHYMHDKYSYESLEMALHDHEVRRFFATGIAGLSCVADSLSAIKHAKVTVVRDENGLAVDFNIEGDYPKFGNNDDRVDVIAKDLVKSFMNQIRNHKTYRDSLPTMSILTITSNVVYGKKTGNTPDGRKAGEPFAPGGNPMHGRDTNGALASLASVAKISYDHARDGISNTFSIVPESLGKDE
ncbi:MAG: formate C-acetyltransferase [bacterium]